MATRVFKCKQNPALKRNGSLKKGYKFLKGGRIVKAKSAKKK